MPLMLVGLGACTVPKRAGFDDVKRLVAEHTGERIHWNQGTAEDAEVARSVDELLSRELTVGAATQIALLNNPRLQALYERLGVAQADLVQAGLLRNPSIFGNVDFSVAMANGGPTYDVAIVQDFLDLFVLPLRKRFARAAFDRVKLEVADSVLELAAQVRASFYALSASTQIHRMRQVIGQAAEASSDLAQRQHDAGNLSELDLGERAEPGDAGPSRPRPERRAAPR